MVSKYVFYCREKRKRQDYFQSSKIERKVRIIDMVHNNFSVI
jgi:hypothetical protein